MNPDLSVEVVKGWLLFPILGVFVWFLSWSFEWFRKSSGSGDLAVAFDKAHRNSMILAAFGVGLVGVLEGPKALITVTTALAKFPYLAAAFGATLAVVLYLVRKRAPIVYGGMEIVVGLVSLALVPKEQLIPEVRALAFLTGVYVTIRGMQFIDTAIKEAPRSAAKVTAAK